MLGTELSRRKLLIGLGGAGGLGLLMACRPTPTAPASTGPPGTVAPIVPVQATPPSVVAPATSAPAPASAAGASGAPKRGGQATILQTNDFVSMDPIFASGPTASSVYDALLTWRQSADGTYGVQPHLARAFETFPNKILFHLRDGVKFHDGSDLTADVVVWNVKRMVQNPKSFAKNLLSAVDDKEPAVALDPMTVQVNLTRPSAAVVSSLSEAPSNGGGTTPLVSKKAAHDNGEDVRKPNTVGTGPFRFVSFASGNQLQVQ